MITRDYESVIYFVAAGDTGFTKIGLTSGSNPRKRLSQLQNGNHEELRFVLLMRGDKHVERKLHDHFEEYRHRGEWFRLPPDWIVELERCWDRIHEPEEWGAGPRMTVREYREMNRQRASLNGRVVTRV